MDCEAYCSVSGVTSGAGSVLECSGCTASAFEDEELATGGSMIVTATTCSREIKNCFKLRRFRGGIRCFNGRRGYVRVEEDLVAVRKETRPVLASPASMQVLEQDRKRPDLIGVVRRLPILNGTPSLRAG